MLVQSVQSTQPGGTIRRPRPAARGRGGRGFTFLEIMIVISIIGILLALVGPKIINRRLDAQIKTTRLQIYNVGQALGMYATDIGDVPTTEEGLAALIQRPSAVSEEQWQQYMEDPPTDAWGRALVYRCPGEDGRSYTLFSCGKDGKEGTEDDITLRKGRAQDGGSLP